MNIREEVTSTTPEKSLLVPNKKTGGRNHTGALFAYKKIETCISKDPILGETVQRLRSQLGS